MVRRWRGVCLGAGFVWTLGCSEVVGDGPSQPTLMQTDPNARFEFPPLQQTVET